jgi:hypothetical protein
VRVGDERAHVAATVGPAVALRLFFHPGVPALHFVGPARVVAFVDRVGRALFWDADVLVAEEELAHARVIGETVHALLAAGL